MGSQSLGAASFGTRIPIATPARFSASTPGTKLSVQYHVEKDETSYLLSGRLLLDRARARCALKIATGAQASESERAPVVAADAASSVSSPSCSFVSVS